MTELNDLLQACFDKREQIYVPGDGRFANWNYCRFCRHIEDHGHADDCQYIAFERAQTESPK